MLSLAEKVAKILALKKMLLKWALRRTSWRTMAATDRALQEWRTPAFWAAAGKHDCRLNRVYELRRKLEALKYK